ncbi:MAG: ABC transporter ATP-binding protein [Planctomycetes bacterium]|nr:ABC transporter ATP-binding protein [Planctomycetota bacterium]
MITNDSPAILVQDLHKTYRDGLIFRRSLDALKGITLRVDQGEIFGLLGPNGAGKTTFVKLLLGIVRKTKGVAFMLGRPVGVRAGRKRVGYLPENLRIPRHHNANSALDLFGQLSGLSGREVKSRRGAILESVGLGDRARDSVKKYSKGMVQRLGLAIALLHDPELIFMDEPTDGLDPLGRTQVREVLLELKAQGRTIFLNSHLLQEVEMVCDRVAILDRGDLLGVGTVEELVPQHIKTIQLELVVVGGDAVVQTVLHDAGRNHLASAAEGGPAYVLDRLSDNQFAIRIKLMDQTDVDRLVDELRRHGVSIISMVRHRISLEEAFLTVLAQAKGRL